MSSGRWQDSDRKTRLPKDWHRQREITLKAAGYRCQWVLEDETRCRAKATDVDHIEAKNEASMRQALCRVHHAQKSAREGVAGRANKRAQRMRPTEGHPALLSTPAAPPRAPLPWLPRPEQQPAGHAHVQGPADAHVHQQEQQAC